MEPIKKRREKFESDKKIYKSEVLKFAGVNGRDVYNCSIPFDHEGDRYIFGRVERRTEWANSVTYLFRYDRESGVWNKVENFDALPIEDPFVSVIGGELIVGGTHVVFVSGKIADYSTVFLQGKKSVLPAAVQHGAERYEGIYACSRSPTAGSACFPAPATRRSAKISAAAPSWGSR